MTIEEPKARNRRKRPAVPTTPDAVEIAMEIAASGQTPADAAMAVLHANALLMHDQAGLTREQISLSREQIGLARNERFRNRIRSIRDIAIAAVVVALLVAAGAVVWTASRTTGLVIQPFSVPPELVEDGLDGRAVAALFQDELVRLDTVTQSARPTASFRNDWSEAITVEVEAGGLSLTDAYTSLTRWLGQETNVSGGMRQTTSGLELVVRSSDGTAITVRGPADQPEALMRQAAERVYEQTQPYRYATYLAATADALPAGPEREAVIDRARSIFTTLVSSPSETERLWGYNGLSRVDSSSAQDALAILQPALEIDPQHPLITLNTAALRLILGQDEGALRVAQRTASSVSRRDNLVKLHSDRRASVPLIVEAQLADLQGDWLQALEVRTRNASLVKSPQAWRGLRRDRVDTLIALHQPSAALRLNNESRLVDKDISNARSGTRALYLPDAEAAASLDQWPQVVAALQAWEVETAPTLPMRFRDARSTFLWPRLAYAQARTGDLAGARTLIAATPLDCYLCVRERARIAELAGDRAAADRWSAEARRQGPSLPFAFAERGQMLMARGDTAGAIDFYEQAIARGPRWADPQKYWGDALMARGDEAGAIRKYRAAAERAPQWDALHLAWGRALEAQGRRDQARDKYTEAARMDLSAADRAEVVRRLGARTSS